MTSNALGVVLPTPPLAENMGNDTLLFALKLQLEILKPPLVY